MDPFIRNDQFNYIRTQAQGLVNGHATVNDQSVLKALKSLTMEKVWNLFPELSEEQKALLSPLIDIKEKADAEAFYENIKPYIIPFKNVTEQTIKKLFPKAKKLKVSLDDFNLNATSYLGWTDTGTNKKFLIVERNNKLIGISGGFKYAHKKGMCTLCNRFEAIGMFTSTTKGATPDAFTTRGNYICQDSQKCNENLMTLEKLDEFVDLIVGK